MTSGHSSEQPPSAARRWIVLLIACAIVPQLPHLGYGFVDYDDVSGIVELPLLRQLSLRSLPQFFSLQVYPGLPEYMPLKNLSYALDYACFGLWAPGYRFQQLFWYALTILCLSRWLRAVFEALARDRRLGLPEHWARPMASISAALFALHPAHVESVTWLSGRKDLLSGAFMALALYCALAFRPGSGRRGRAYFAAVLVTSALALLSKPMAVTLPALMLLADVLCAPRDGELRSYLRQRLALYACVCLLVAVYAGVYLWLVRDYTPVDAQYASELYRGPSLLRWGQQLYHFVALSLAPERMTPYMPPGLLDEHWLSLRAVLGLALLGSASAAFVWLTLRRHPLSLALGLFALPLAPILLAPPWAQYVAGRYLFLSVAGLSLALVWTGSWVLHHRPRLSWAVWTACGLIALRFGVGTLDYGREFRDSLTLWTSAIERYPAVVRYYQLAGAAAVRARDAQLAARIFEACLRVDPEDASCNVGLAVQVSRSQPAYARDLLARALPNDQSGFAHVALALQTAVQGEPREALQFFERWLNGRPMSNPNEVSAYVQVALLADEPKKAWNAAVQGTRMFAARFPAGMPPTKPLVDAAQARGDAELAQHVRAIVGRCQRADCVVAALADL